MKGRTMSLPLPLVAGRRFRVQFCFAENAIETRPEINKQSFAERDDLASTKTIQITGRSSINKNGKWRA
jgi:hypothetical protein